LPIFTLHDLSLTVEHDAAALPGSLENLFAGLSFTRTDSLEGQPPFRLSVRRAPTVLKLPSSGREVFQAGDLRGLETKDAFYVTDGASSLRLQAAERAAEARLEPSFYSKPSLLQHNFWAIGLIKLFRGGGIYPVHGAGLITPEGGGLLIVAKSGCGKSTLTIGLIRRGWRYLSDDTVLLRARDGVVQALPLRRHFYVDSMSKPRYEDLQPSEPVVGFEGRPRRRIDMDRTHPDRFVSKCTPRLLIFPQIVSTSRSTLEPLDDVSALQQVLGESGPELFDRSTMAHQLEVLRQLVKQGVSMTLRAGSDLYHDPGRLADLLQQEALG
jgi:hypothetical protein